MEKPNQENKELSTDCTDFTETTGKFLRQKEAGKASTNYTKGRMARTGHLIVDICNMCDSFYSCNSWADFGRSGTSPGQIVLFKQRLSSCSEGGSMSLEGRDRERKPRHRGKHPSSTETVFGDTGSRIASIERRAERSGHRCAHEWKRSPRLRKHPRRRDDRMTPVTASRHQEPASTTAWSDRSGPPVEPYASAQGVPLAQAALPVRSAPSMRHPAGDISDTTGVQETKG